MLMTETAGGVVLNKEGEVLVVNQNNDSWSLPKGHVDLGETEMEAAVREIYEESGIENVTFAKSLGSYQRYKIGLNGGDDTSELKNIHIFLYTTEEMDLVPIDPCNPEARWVSKDEVAALLTHSKDKEFFSSILDQI